MFYSHEILTSRKHGVATIWLVATLGSKSTLKKVNRKAINEVNVPRACEVILTPEIPMALRLQSHLLYGVSRVYSQQCGYVLLDAQNTQTNMRQMLKSVRHVGNELDLDAGRTRPDLLMVQDDPTFVPDLAFTSMNINLDWPGLDLTTNDESSGGDSSLFSPSAHRLSQLSRDGSPGIRIPSSGSEAGGALGGLGRLSLGDTSSINRPSGRERALLHPDDDELGFLPDADFGFDADGNLFDIESPALVMRPDQAVGVSARAGSDSAAIERVLREHEDARRAAMEGRDDDLDLNDLPPIDNEYAMIPDAEPFPERNKLDSSSTLRGDKNDEEADYAAAPMKRKKRAVSKVIPLDNTLQLRNSAIADRCSNYVAHMEKEVAQKIQRAGPALAKKNADYWIWGSGIGGIGRNASLLGTLDPLIMFYGEKLMERISGVKVSAAGKKRDRASIESETDGEEPRRVRPRGESAEEEGRGHLEFEGDDDGLAPIGGDEDLEIGRNAPTPGPGDEFHEASSVMPWNLSASQRSSTLQQGRRAGISSRAGSVGSGSAQAPLFGGRYATSASPLINRGVANRDRRSNQDTIDPSALTQEPAERVTSSGFDDVGGGDDFELPDGNDLNTQEEFELFGPAAYVDTQNAEQSQWLRATMDNESVNFLAFVKVACVPADGGAEGEVFEKAIEFETLLPPETNSKMIAAQALLHCLSLATKRLLRVLQEEAYGPISLSVLN